MYIFLFLFILSSFLQFFLNLCIFSSLLSACYFHPCFIGLGYSDVENRLLCSSDTVLRIASISKSITMTAVAKLWEEGKIDLDKPIQDYVPYFPSKDFEGKPVIITLYALHFVYFVCIF